MCCTDTTATARVSVSQLADTPATAQQQNSAPAVDSDGITAEIRPAIGQANTPEQITAIRAQVEELKQTLSITDYTELKNKVVKRHRQITTVATVNN